MALHKIGDEAITDVYSGSFRKRRKAISEGGNCLFWSELPPALLELIFNKLGAIEFLTCACVCKSWREVALAFKQHFMASQLPIVFLMSTNARKYCYLYNMFDKSLHRTPLPHLAGNKCLGFTCGYLVLRDSELTKKKDHIWLVHPFTRHELEFPRPPKPYFRVILASLAAAQQYVVVAYSNTHPFLQFCRCGDADWTVCDYGHDNNVGWTILDIAVFKGKIHVLTSHGRLGVLSLNSKNPMVTLLPVKNIVEMIVPVSVCDRVHVDLVASRQGLYASSFRPSNGLSMIQRLDFEKMVWEEVNMKGEILFISDTKSSGLISFATPSPLFPLEENSAAGEPLRRVCYLGEEGLTSHGPTARYVAGSMKKCMLAVRSRWKPEISFGSVPLWYFPHLSCTVDSVCED